MIKTAFTSAALVVIGNVATADYCDVINRYHSIALVAPGKHSVSTQIELCKGGVATLVVAEAIGTLVIGAPQVVAANLGSTRLVFLTALNIGKSDILITSETGEKLETISLNVIEPAPPEPITVIEKVVAPTEHSETEDAPDGISHHSEINVEKTDQQTESEPESSSTVTDDTSRQIVIIKGTEMGLVECTDFCLKD